MNNKINYAPHSLSPILLTPEEYQDIKARYPGIAEEEISKLAEYITSNGKRYDSHYATLLKWCREDAPRPATAEEDHADYVRRWNDEIKAKIKQLRQWKAEGKSDEDLQALKYEIISIQDSIKRLL